MFGAKYETDVQVPINRRSYHCPCCGKYGNVVQVDKATCEDQDETYHWYRVHIECPDKCPVLWACVDVPIDWI